MTELHDRRFPGETPDYRRARDELLRAELELRRRTEEVAALRRRLPLGGVVRDYVFEEGPADLSDDTTRRVALRELFGAHDTLVLYNFMYGPAMARPCPMCSSLIDGLQGVARHLESQLALAIVARSPIARVRAFARERGWDRLRLVSSAENQFGRDFHGEDPDGAQQPMLHVFVREGGDVRHFWSSELMFLPSDPGQDSRHVDFLSPLWSLLDITPRGRRRDWYPDL